MEECLWSYVKGYVVGAEYNVPNPSLQQRTTTEYSNGYDELSPIIYGVKRDTTKELILVVIVPYEVTAFDPKPATAGSKLRRTEMRKAG